MPSSALSSPSISSSSETRIPIVAFSASQPMALAMDTNAPIKTTPQSCVRNEPLPKMPTAKVPQIPATRWAEIAPTTSSIFSLSSSGTAMTTSKPPIAPTTIAKKWFWRSGPAVIAYLAYKKAL